jgi:uncharacterized protein (UPF0332 family)
MSEEQAALVRYRLGEAKETLEEARLLARESRWRGALNRVYYAMFYATLALLAARQLASSRHSGVIALFHREFVRPGLFAREWARYLDIAFNLRNRSDYQDFIAPDVVQVEELLEAAEPFITEAERLGQQLLSQQNKSG